MTTRSLHIDAPSSLHAPLAQLAQHLALPLAPDAADATIRLTHTDGEWQLHCSTGHRSIACPASLGLLAEALQQAAIRPDISLGASGWYFDPSLRQCRHPDAAPIALTDKESLLLAALLPGTPIAREALQQQVWAYDPEVDSHTLDTHLYRLRSKLEPISGLAIRAESGHYSLSLS